MNTCHSARHTPNEISSLLTRYNVLVRAKNGRTILDRLRTWITKIRETSWRFGFQHNESTKVLEIKRLTKLVMWSSSATQADTIECGWKITIARHQKFENWESKRGTGEKWKQKEKTWIELFIIPNLLVRPRQMKLLFKKNFKWKSNLPSSKLNWQNSVVNQLSWCLWHDQEIVWWWLHVPLAIIAVIEKMETKMAVLANSSHVLGITIAVTRNYTLNSKVKNARYCFTFYCLIFYLFLRASKFICQKPCLFVCYSNTVAGLSSAEAFCEKCHCGKF